MQSPLTVVQSAYQAWEDHDLVEVLCAFAPDAEFHLEHARLPYSGDLHGRDSMGQIIRDILDDWRTFEIKPLRYSSGGEIVAVFGRYEGDGKVSGFHFEDSFVHVWDVEDGRGVWMGIYSASGRALHDLDHLLASRDAKEAPN